MRGAIRDLRRAADAPHTRKTLAVAYYAERQFTLFEQMMRSVVAETPDDFAPYYYLGRHYDTDHRDFGTAASYFEDAARRNRAHAPSYYYLGFSREQLGEFELSAKAYERARSLRPDYVLPWIGLARLWLTAAETDEAVALAKEAARLAPSDAAAHKVLARALAAVGAKGEAVAVWERVAELDPTDASAFYHLYRAYLESGHEAKARLARTAFDELRRVYGVE